MDRAELHESVAKMPVSLATQTMAQKLLASLRHSRLDSLMARVNEGENRALLGMPLAVCLDVIDVYTKDATKRPQVYRFNRELGLSALEAVRHSSPDTGYHTAVFALAAVTPE